MSTLRSSSSVTAVRYYLPWPLGPPPPRMAYFMQIHQEPQDYDARRVIFQEAQWNIGWTSSHADEAPRA